MKEVTTRLTKLCAAATVTGPVGAIVDKLVRVWNRDRRTEKDPTTLEPQKAVPICFFLRGRDVEIMLHDTGSMIHGTKNLIYDTCIIIMVRMATLPPAQGVT